MYGSCTGRAAYSGKLLAGRPGPVLIYQVKVFPATHLSMSHSILELRNIKCSLEEGVNLFSDVNITVNQGSVPLLSEIGR